MRVLKTKKRVKIFLKKKKKKKFDKIINNKIDNAQA